MLQGLLLEGEQSPNQVADSWPSSFSRAKFKSNGTSGEESIKHQPRVLNQNSVSAPARTSSLSCGSRAGTLQNGLRFVLYPPKVPLEVFSLSSFQGADQVHNKQIMYN